MTVIRPNSVSGITSITAQANEINVFRSNGTLAGLNLNGVNFNTTAGISTLAALDVGNNIKFGNAGVVTATSYRGDGSQLTGISAGVSLANGVDNRVVTATGAAALNGEANLTFDGSALNLQKTGTPYILVGSTNAGGASLVLDGDSNGDASGTDYAYLTHNTDGDLVVLQSLHHLQYLHYGCYPSN